MIANEMPTKEQFIDMSMPITESGCWIWMGSVSSNGYGNYKIKNKQIKPHRLSYELFIDEIDKGLQVCHKCDIKVCVNPNHLFIGTQKDNIQDAVKKKRMFNQRKTRCPKGHKYEENNIYRLSDKSTRRLCRQCYREKSHRRYWEIIRPLKNNI